jgi:hypothetical protein
MLGGWHRDSQARAWLMWTHSHRVRVDQKVLKHLHFYPQVLVTLKRVHLMRMRSPRRREDAAVVDTAATRCL